LNAWHGGTGFYFRDPNGHILELLTRVQQGQAQRDALEKTHKLLS
jgi:hypothetical protein